MPSGHSQMRLSKSYFVYLVNSEDTVSVNMFPQWYSLPPHATCNKLYFLLPEVLVNHILPLPNEKCI